MRVGVTAQQHRLKKDHARIPNRRPASQQRQQHFGDHRLDPEQQRCAEEQSCREQRSHDYKVQAELVLRMAANLKPGAYLNAGTITLLADCQFAVAINASLARSSGNRCVTVSAKGNTFEVACKNARATPDRKSTRLNSSHVEISYA